MANDIHKIKLLVLWDILCKNTDEDHAMNTDEIIACLADRGIEVSRKTVVEDIKTLCAYGYEVLSYKKKFHYYYVVNRSLDTAEVVMLADAVNASKLSASQKKTLIERLSGILCYYQAENISKHIVSLERGRKGNSSFIYNVDAIDRAINENNQVSFQYFDYDEKHRKVYRKGGYRSGSACPRAKRHGRSAENQNNNPFLWQADDGSHRSSVGGRVYAAQS